LTNFTDSLTPNAIKCIHSEQSYVIQTNGYDEAEGNKLLGSTMTSIKGIIYAYFPESWSPLVELQYKWLT